MVQRDLVIPALKIKDKSVFSLDELYKLLIRWFEFHVYELQEREYRDEDMGGGKKHIEIKWYAERKINDYFKFVIETSFLLLGLEEIEIERAGVKRRSNRGEVEIKIKAYILKDYDNKWETGMMYLLRGFYEKYLIKSSIVELEKEIDEEVYKYVDEIKAFFNLHRI